MLIGLYALYSIGQPFAITHALPQDDGGRIQIDPTVPGDQEARKPFPPRSAQRRRFEQDLIYPNWSVGQPPRYDRGQDIYEFQGFGEFRALALTDEELDTLAFLAETFGPDAPHGEPVQALLHRVQEMLPDNQQNTTVEWLE